MGTFSLTLFSVCFSRCYSFHDDEWDGEKAVEKRVFFKERDWTQKPTIRPSQSRHVWISLPFEFDTKWHIRVGGSAHIIDENRRLVINPFTHIIEIRLVFLSFVSKRKVTLAVYVRFIKRNFPHCKMPRFFCWDFMDITVVVIPVLLQRRSFVM